MECNDEWEKQVTGRENRSSGMSQENWQKEGYHILEQGANLFRLKLVTENWGKNYIVGEFEGKDRKSKLDLKCTESQYVQMIT